MTPKDREMAFRQPFNDRSDLMDRSTSRSICEAVGERLRQSMKPESTDLPSQLQRLLDEMQRRER